MKKKKKESKKLFIVILISILIIALSIFIRYYIKYMNPSYKDLLGTWIDVEYPDSPLKLTYPDKFSIGYEKNLECDLWNCGGYDEGSFNAYNNIIVFDYGAYLTCSYEYSIKEKDRDKILTLKFVKLSEYSDECEEEGHETIYKKKQ